MLLIKPEHLNPDGTLLPGDLAAVAGACNELGKRIASGAFSTTLGGVDIRYLPDGRHPLSESDADSRAPRPLIIAAFGGIPETSEIRRLINIPKPLGIEFTTIGTINRPSGCVVSYTSILCNARARFAPNSNLSWIGVFIDRYDHIPLPAGSIITNFRGIIDGGAYSFNDDHFAERVRNIAVRPGPPAALQSALQGLVDDPQLIEIVFPTMVQQIFLLRPPLYASAVPIPAALNRSITGAPLTRFIAGTRLVRALHRKKGPRDEELAARHVGKKVAELAAASASDPAVPAVEALDPV